MSMLSAQCDNLRMMARLVLDYEPKEIRRALRDAADTIWQLRNDCEQLTEENDHMRNMLEDLWPRAAFTMTEANKATWLAELEDVGAEVAEP